jgi:hypothetical protein
MGGDAMKIACVMMQRNEDKCLEPWLRYHGHLFGYDSLFVIDHNSDDPGVLATLKAFIGCGGHVMRLPPAADYRRKGDFVSYAMKQAEFGHDFVLPLDCDEFVAMRLADGRATCAREHLAAYFASLPADGTAFEVGENFLNMLGHPKQFFALPYKKVFFRGGHCGVVDHGSHTAIWAPVPVAQTRLAYVHFHHKSFERYCRSAKEQLRPFVDVNDAAALETYRGPGWHMVTHLNKTAQEFYAIMTPDSRCFEFLELYETLLELGIDPAFCDR